jgi:hypothetical protein
VRTTSTGESYIELLELVADDHLMERVVEQTSEEVHDFDDVAPHGGALALCQGCWRSPEGLVCSRHCSSRESNRTQQIPELDRSRQYGERILREV